MLRETRKVPLASGEVPQNQTAENTENADTKTPKMQLTGFVVMGFLIIVLGLRVVFSPYRAPEALGVEIPEKLGETFFASLQKKKRTPRFDARITFGESLRGK